MSKVGWVGVGAMGFPMAVRLAHAGHEVTAYDVDPARLHALAASGVGVAPSLAALAANADVLGLMVATPAQVDSVLFGEDSVADALQRGTVVILMATVGPDAARHWGSDLASRGIELVDAPVSGGVRRATDGDLLMMVAGGPAVERVRPVLEALASTITIVGDHVGDGQKVKLVNQLLCGVHIAVAAEALAFAEALGLDAAETFETLRHGAAASFMLDDRGDRMTRAAFDDVRSALDIFVKDMGLVVDAARAESYPTPLASAAQQLYLAGHRAGLGRRDDSSIIEVLRGHPAPS